MQTQFTPVLYINEKLQIIPAQGYSPFLNQRCVLNLLRLPYLVN
jgi:hypothetical protein